MSIQTSSTSRLFRQVGTVKLRKGPMTALFLTGHRQLISDSGSASGLLVSVLRSQPRLGHGNCPREALTPDTTWGDTAVMLE